MLNLDAALGGLPTILKLMSGIIMVQIMWNEVST